MRNVDETKPGPDGSRDCRTTGYIYRELPDVFPVISQFQRYDIINREFNSTKNITFFKFGLFLLNNVVLP